MRCIVCNTSVPDSKWDNIRAHSAGWFEQKDSTAYCPVHVPAWVQKWRTRHVRQHGTSADQAGNDR